MLDRVYPPRESAMAEYVFPLVTNVITAPARGLPELSEITPEIDASCI